MSKEKWVFKRGEKILDSIEVKNSLSYILHKSLKLTPCKCSFRPINH